MIPSRHSARATRALQKLAEEDPAFAALALWCTHADSDARPGPAWTDGAAIRYGPAFEALSLPEQIGVAAHHILHVAFRHAPRTRAMYLRFGDRFDEDLFNLATDAIVNETLMLSGFILPRPVVRLTGLLKTAAREDLGADEAVTRYDAERLYLRLLQDDAAPQNGKPGDRGVRAGGTTGEGQGRGSTGEARPRPGGAVAEAARDYGRQQGFAPDIETGGTDSDQGAGSEADADWRQRVARAMEAGRIAGHGLGMLGHRLADLPEVHTPWEQHLRALVTRAVTVQPQPRNTRPARRWIARDSDARARGEPSPAFEYAWTRDLEIPRIVVGIDSSGSVEPTLLAKFAAEVAGISKRTGAETHVLVFDTKVQGHQVMGGGLWEGRIADVLFSREGGTSFIAVMEEALALGPSAVVILTDLLGPFGPPPPRGLPVIWAVPGEVPPGGAPFGQVLSLAR
ncbi:VWA-like domain-containing protein [Rhodovulum sp. BSW8]|uniref:vWA domain-containing protein n=1 Tax=Rhodovulum sp. BSW8 TaxID=2259645 RepID=UPI001FB3DCBB|nr:VWA-like domain-containing protein [Rhodovulum sp. BSW8]